jgi:hypothetical protein
MNPNHQTKAASISKAVAAGESIELDAQHVADLHEALNFCRSLMATATRDYREDKIDVLLSAVLCGNGCEDDLMDPSHEHDWLCGGDQDMTFQAERHGWSPKVVEKLRRFRSAVAIVSTEPKP